MINNRQLAFEKQIRDLGDQVFALKKLMADSDARYAENIRDIRDAVIETIVSGPKMIEDDPGGGIAIDDKPGGNFFSLRYRNDTESGNPQGIHRLESIAKASPYIPEAEWAVPGVPEFWPDEDWTAVPGGQAIEHQHVP